jgi:hypothetical protein
MAFGTMALRLVAGLGVAACVVFGGMAASTGLAIWRAPAGPAPSTVAAAPENRWVLLEDAVLVCPPPDRPRRLIRAHDREGTTRFLVYLEDPKRCPEVQRLDGAFIGKFSREFLRARAGLQIPPGQDERVFSQLEAPRFLRGRLGRQLQWFGVSLLIAVLAIRAVWRREPPQRPLQRRLTKSGRVPARD